MRPRHLVILVVLAAIPIGLAVALSGGGTHRARGSATAAQVSLHLVGGKVGAAIRACGATHHYKIYPVGSTIGFRGAGSLRGGPTVKLKLKLKLKLKACFGGAFQPAGEIPATVAANGSYTSNFRAPSAGAYFARAELKQGGALVTRSRKRYFEVR